MTPKLQMKHVIATCW